jgi:hypothetical protein
MSSDQDFLDYICDQLPVKKPWGQTVAYVRGKEGSLVDPCSPVGG